MDFRRRAGGMGDASRDDDMLLASCALAEENSCGHRRPKVVAEDLPSTLRFFNSTVTSLSSGFTVVANSVLPY